MEEEGLNKIAVELQDYVEAATALESENKHLQRSIAEMRAKFVTAKSDWRRQSLEYAEKRERRVLDTMDETLFELFQTKHELRIYKTFYEGKKAKDSLLMLDFNGAHKHVAIVNHSGEQVELCDYKVCFSKNYQYAFNASSGVLKNGESLSLWWGAENRCMVSDDSGDRSFHYAVDPLISQGRLTLLKDDQVVDSIADSSTDSRTSQSSATRTNTTGKKRARDDTDGADENTANKMRRGESTNKKVAVPASSSSSSSSISRRADRIGELCGSFIFDSLRKPPSLRIERVSISPSAILVSFDNRGSLPVSIDNKWKVWLLSPTQEPVSCSCESFSAPGSSQSEMSASLPSDSKGKRFTHIALSDSQGCVRTACHRDAIRYTRDENAGGEWGVENSCVIS